MQKLRIDLQKFHGAKQFTSKDGTDFIAIPIHENNIFVGTKGLYISLTLHDNKDGKDQYENDGFASVDVSKEAREAGEKGQIIGNWKHLDVKPKAAAPKAKSVPPKDEGLTQDDVPF